MSTCYVVQFNGGAYFAGTDRVCRWKFTYNVETAHRWKTSRSADELATWALDISALRNSGTATSTFMQFPDTFSITEASVVELVETVKVINKTTMYTRIHAERLKAEQEESKRLREVNAGLLAAIRERTAARQA